MKKDGFGTRTAEGSAQGQSQNQRAGGAIIAGPHPADKVLYTIIAFFLGGLGIQEFYAGHTGLGILCLLFRWTGLPAIFALVRIIMAICARSDVNGNIVI